MFAYTGDYPALLKYEVVCYTQDHSALLKKEVDTHMVLAVRPTKVLKVKTLRDNGVALQTSLGFSRESLPMRIK